MSLAQDADEERQCQRYELIDVLANALVGVVRVAVQHLQTVVDLPAHPAPEILICHPCAPLNGEHLPEIDGIDRDEDIDHREYCKLADERPERRPVIGLESVVEDAVPIVDADEYIDAREIQRDDRREQSACAPFFRRTPISFEQLPEYAQQR